MSQLRSAVLRLLLAFGLGFSLWVYVTFSENPDQTATFREVPVRVEGKSPGLVLVDERGLPLPTDSLPARLDLIAVQADSQSLSTLSRADIDAYVDLTGLSPGDYNRPVLAQSKRPDLRLRFSEIQPSYIPIRIERVISATVPFSVVVSGSVPFVYERDEAQIVGDLTSAQVTGPESLVRQVTLARATADVAGLTASFEASLPLLPLDAAGEPVEGVDVIPAEATVLVPIRPTVGIKPVAITAPDTVGSPAPGYQVTDIDVSPLFVNLTGSSDALAAVESVTTVPIDIGGASASFTRDLQLQIPDGVSLFVNAPRVVRMTVTLAPIDRPVTFSSPLAIQVVNIGSGLLLRNASPAQVLVELSADAARIDDLDASEGRAFVDVAGLGAGTHQVRPNIVLPVGLQLVGDVPEVTVVLVAPTAPPAPTRAQPTPTSVAPTDIAEPTATSTPTTPAPSPTPTPGAGPADPGTPAGTTDVEPPPNDPTPADSTSTSQP